MSVACGPVCHGWCLLSGEACHVDGVASCTICSTSARRGVAPYRIRRGDAGLWFVEQRHGEGTLAFAHFTLERAVAEVCRIEAYRLAGGDFALDRTPRGGIQVWRLGSDSRSLVRFQSWEQAALYLWGVREREQWRTLRRLERALSLPATPFPGLAS